MIVVVFTVCAILKWAQHIIGCPIQQWDIVLEDEHQNLSILILGEEEIISDAIHYIDDKGK